MMLQEKDIEIDFTNAKDALKFDQTDTNKANCHDVRNMCRVDFVVEFDEAIVFVEIKDPQITSADQTSIDKFTAKLISGKLYTSFVNKYIDTFFFRWAEDKLSKDVYYLILVTLEDALLPTISEEVAKKLSPANRTSTRWVRHPLKNCQAFNIDTWNAAFPAWPVKRLSNTAPLAEGA